MSPAYYLVEEGHSTGPHSLAVLAQKAEVHALRPDSLVCPVESAEAPDWRPIRELPELHDHLFAPRTLPSLGAARFAAVNSEIDQAAAPFVVEQALRDNTARQRAAEGELLKDLGPRPNRRRRDYLFCAGGLNLFVLLLGPLIGYGNPFLVGLWAIGNVSLVWILYGVMDRY